MAGPNPLAALNSVRQRLLAHPLPDALRDAAHVCVFMRHHVFCVWDSMSLVKALQRRLTGTELPWLPTPDPETRRLVNELVLVEESDIDGRGGHLSHFELYLAAMRDAGADSRPMLTLLAELQAGRPLDTALDAAGTPPATAAFVRRTLDFARNASLHRLAAAFRLGREDLLPDLFGKLLDHLTPADAVRFERFRFYLARHGKPDDEAMKLLDRLCADDARRWQEAADAGRTCLEARLAVWDEVLVALRARPARIGSPATASRG